MILLILFTTILVVGNFAQNFDADNEPSLCVEHQNPFTYTHCINKRDLACQNGQFCGSCNTNTCQTCNGNSCKTSCSGPACSQCPNGNCCNGQNCNVCSGLNCCSGQSCNNCVNTCNMGCQTPACRSSCFQTCQNNNCCDRSDCFQTCRNQCVGDHCYENCFKQCPCSQNCNPAPTISPSSPPVMTPPIIIYPNISFPAQTPPKSNQTIIVVNRPENHNPVNITTVLNVKNYISNKNIITIPVNVTNHNHNHFNQTSPSQNEKDPIIDNTKCCIVVYPIHCYDIAEPPYKKCIQKRENKCGDICTSVVVHVVHVPGRPVPMPYPVPVQVPGPVQVVQQPVPYPVIQRYPFYVQMGTPANQCGVSGGCGYRPMCHYINRYPWISCSHYGVQNCGSCYVCGGQYNPAYCRQQISCAPLCRGGVVNFGNTWQNDIMRFASLYSTQYAGQTPIQGPQPQIETQQPLDLSAQQQIVQPPIVQQPVDLVQQPTEYQQAGIQQQYMMPQSMHQQYVAVQQPYKQQPIQQVVQQPGQLQQQAGVVG